MKVILNVIIFHLYINLINSQSSESLSEDNALCTCDLTLNKCDENCCCDRTCTANERKLFSTCSNQQALITKDRVCFYKTKTFDKTSKNESIVDAKGSGGLCIYSTNNNKFNYYVDQPLISDISQLNNILDGLGGSDSTNSAISKTSVDKTSGLPTSDSLYPKGFQLSGNIGYIPGKPVMLAANQTSSTKRELTLSSNPNEWWRITGIGECSTAVLKQDSVLFGYQKLSGCEYNVAKSSVNCAKLQQDSLIFLDIQEATLRNMRIASFAKVNLTNLPDWVNVTNKLSESSLPGSGNCKVVVNAKFEVLYARVGRDNYPHNKIVAVQLEKTTRNFDLTVDNKLFLKVIVNFVDVSGSKERVTKLSPFLNVRLPYDFFFPIYTP